LSLASRTRRSGRRIVEPPLAGGRAVHAPSERAWIGRLGWATVAPMAAGVAARLLGAERSTPSLWANALAPWLYLPVYPVAVLALKGRRPGLSLLAVAVGAAHLAVVLPDLQAAGAIPAATLNAPRLRLLSANLFDRNPTPDAMATAVLATEADVLALQEVTPWHQRALERAGVLAAYPFAIADPRPGAVGSAIYSRLRLQDAQVWRAGGQPMTRCTVQVGTTHVRLYNVHTTGPRTARDRSRWAAQLAGVAAALRDEPTPLVVAGDFNATRYHRSFQTLLGQGRLRDAHLERGRGLVATWPANRRLVPPLARLDHVLVSAGVTVLDVAERTGLGSDHRMVLAELAVPPGARGGPPE
jgi:endonuclease/exonuclease/phosphatase (EEP) superfamily protein YafD